MLKGRKVIALLLALALFGVGCGGSDGDGDAAPEGGGTDTETTEVREVGEGGEATLIQFIDSRSLDPTTIINSYTQGSTIMNALFDVLFTVVDGEVQGRLATDFSTEDGLTWTMTLREGVTFTDGTPLTAEAVQAQWARLRENPRAPAFSVFADLESTRVVDDLTFEVVLREPNRQFHNAVVWSNAVWIPSPTAYDADPEGFAENPVGAGPFLVRNRVPNVETVFESNPNFWEAGYPKLDRLTVRTLSDSQQILDTLRTGGADAGGMDILRVGMAREQGMIVDKSHTLIGANCWLFSDSRPPFDDIRARRAVYLALDMESLNEDLFQGAETIATSLFPEGTVFHNPDITFPESDAEEAQRLFDELAAEGKPVRFAITVPATPSNTSWAVQLQTQLRAFENVEVEINNIDPASYGVTLYGGDFDLAVYGFVGADPEPTVATMRSDWAIPIASMRSPEIDAAIQKGRAAETQEGRQAAYDELQQELNDLYRVKWQAEYGNRLVYTQRAADIIEYGQGSWLLHAFGLVK